jgi:hypothetical protein
MKSGPVADVVRVDDDGETLARTERLARLRRGHERE